MGMNLLVTCVIYQILITTSSSDLMLPSTDLVDTVTPVKPKSASLSTTTIKECQLPAVPNVPNPSEAILEYYKSQFAEENEAPIVGEYSSPLMLTSSSKPMSASNTTFIQNVSVLQEYETNALLPNIHFSYNLPQVYQLGQVPVLPQYFQKVNQLDTNRYQYDFSPCPQIFDSQLSSYQPDYLSQPSKDAVLMSTVTALPRVTMKRHADMSSFLSVPRYDNPFAPYSSPTGSSIPFYPSYPTQSIFSFGTQQCVDPLYNLPYPLRYELLTLPEVMTPYYAGTANFVDSCHENYIINPNSYIMDNLSGNQFGPQLVEQSYMSIINSPLKTKQIYACKPQSNLITTAFSPTNCMHNSLSSPYCHTCKFVDPYCIDVPDFKLDPFEFEPITFEFDSTPHFINNLDSNVEYQKNFVIPDLFPVIDHFMDTLDYNLENSFQILNHLANTPYPIIPDIPDDIPEFVITQEICTEEVVPEIPLEPLTSDQFLPGISTCQINPASHVNLASSHPVCESSSRVLPDVNEAVLNIARLYASNKYEYSCNPFIQPEQNILCPSLIPTNSTNPTFTLLAPTETINILKSSLKMSSSPLYKDLNAFNDDFLSSSHVTYSPDFSSEMIEILPVSTSITVIPAASFSDFSPTQTCPSYLPLPIIPSSFSSYEPFTIEPQIVKLKSLNQKPKTLEKLLELVLLAELINDNEEIDWCALDNMMKFLSK